jgi:hypothetical protein
MKRTRLLFLVGIALLVGLYLYDRDNRTDMVMPATITSFESQSSDGPDTWHISVDLDGKTQALDPVTDRPNVAVGDTICVTKVVRQGKPDQFFHATGSEGC